MTNQISVIARIICTICKYNKNIRIMTDKCNYLINVQNFPLVNLVISNEKLIHQ